MLFPGLLLGEWVPLPMPSEDTLFRVATIRQDSPFPGLFQKVAWIRPRPLSDRLPFPTLQRAGADPTHPRADPDLRTVGRMAIDGIEHDDLDPP